MPIVVAQEAICIQTLVDAVGLSGSLVLGATAVDPPRQEPFGAETWLLDPEGNRLLLLVMP